MTGLNLYLRPNFYPEGFAMIVKAYRSLSAHGPVEFPGRLIVGCASKTPDQLCVPCRPAALRLHWSALWPFLLIHLRAG